MKMFEYAIRTKLKPAIMKVLFIVLAIMVRFFVGRRNIYF
jgi:hypothetical protein